MTDAERIKRIAVVLKKHFTNLDVMRTLDIAQEIIMELDK